MRICFPHTKPIFNQLPAPPVHFLERRPRKKKVGTKTSGNHLYSAAETECLLSPRTHRPSLTSWVVRFNTKHRLFHLALCRKVAFSRTQLLCSGLAGHLFLPPIHSSLERSSQYHWFSVCNLKEMEWFVHCLSWEHSDRGQLTSIPNFL